MTAGAGLTINSAAVDIDKNIEPVLPGYYHQGLPNNKGMLPLGKILINILSVYGNFAVSVPYINPGYRCLPSAGSNTKILYHLILLSSTLCAYSTYLIEQERSS